MLWGKLKSADKWQKVLYRQQQRIWQGIEDKFSLFIARYFGASIPQSCHSLLQQDWLRKQRVNCFVGVELASYGVKTTLGS
ncbi:uncharacterized protein LOC126718524 isoform X3 [Quercus robur]|uniref:uncharacterized protein LOC126718524 isoform X3 n=1 Tax=Quercus robur TaxID=38942 RepID=UPI0021615683|nr:uncharacterized protein LOC126718524 isoform X3 [Quercus robur]